MLQNTFILPMLFSICLSLSVMIFSKFHMAMQSGKDSITSWCKSGMSGVGKVCCHQPFCQVSYPSTSRYLWNFIFWPNKTISPEIRHSTSNAQETSWGFTMHLTVNYKLLDLPLQLSLLFICIQPCISWSLRPSLLSTLTHIYDIEERRGMEDRIQIGQSM